jgi:hypothetical protein
MKKKKNRQLGDKSYIFESDNKPAVTNKFPIEGFVELKGYQNGKPIKLHTYKYPAKDGNIKGIVYLM